MNDAAGVTTIITRRVRPGCTAAYEARLAQLLDDASSIDGYLGADVRPPPPDDPDTEYVSIVRFASVEQLREFQRSEPSTEFQHDVADMVRSDAVWDTRPGLEFWFDPPAGTTAPQPVRWRMAVVLGVVVYVLVLVFGTAAARWLGGWPGPVRLAVVIAVEIVVMTYVLLPRITGALAGWIYPARGPDAAETPGRGVSGRLQ